MRDRLTVFTIGILLPGIVICPFVDFLATFGQVLLYRRGQIFKTRVRHYDSSFEYPGPTQFCKAPAIIAMRQINTTRGRRLDLSFARFNPINPFR